MCVSETREHVYADAAPGARAPVYPTRPPADPDGGHPPNPRGTVRLARSTDAEEAGDIRIGWGPLYGNPFEARSDSQRRPAREAYRELLRTCAPIVKLARHYGLAVRRGTSEAHGGSVARMRALSRLAERVRHGENLRLRCSQCAAGPCHGEVILEWILARVDP